MDVFEGSLIFVVGGSIGAFLAYYKYKFALKTAFLEKKGLSDKLALLLEMQKKSGDEFQGISSKVFHQSSESFLKLANATFEKREENLKFLLKPVKESLEKLDVKLHELEKARVGAYHSLKEQLTTLVQTEKELKVETSNLVKVLRTPINRGQWGEIQLRRVVELAGMLEHCDFVEQKTLEGEERKLRPDLIVHLPGKRYLIIDSKAPLDCYLEAIDCVQESEARLKMKEHARQIRSHMTSLSKKSYADFLPSSPDFVILFLPSESFFSAALEHDPLLIEAGIDQKVILATPTTLIALLKSVSYGWRQEALSKNAEQISALGKELYKRIHDMSSHFGKVGKHLETAVQAYNQTLATLETRVLVSARRFKDLEAHDKEKEIEHVATLTTLPKATSSLALEEPQNSASDGRPPA